MRERAITLLLALAALLAFYALWLRPLPSMDEGADAARPTTGERRGNGYAGLYEWLQRSGIAVSSWRERYTALADASIPPRGNLMILTLPGMDTFRNDEFAALDKWVRRGNTLFINAALLDQPGWAVGRESGVVSEVESLTSIEFESKRAREARLDDTPLAQRVREADARDAKKDKDKDKNQDDEQDDDLDEIRPFSRDLSIPKTIELSATGPHALLAGVHKLSLETDYEVHEWSLRMPYDNFLLTLARGQNGEGALFEQRLGKGRVLLAAGGTLFTNRALGDDDNAQLMSNIVGATVAPGGSVLFDDLRQGLSASYDPARFYRDSRLYKTLFILLGLWLVWVVGGTRLRAPAFVAHDPSEAELVRRAGGLIARTVPSWNAALALFDRFFAAVARAAGERGEQWQWLERHAAILPQELDQLKTWYADAHAMRKVPLVSLQNLLDQLERRLKT
jgi:Domain of unknown function (DUF4350)